MHFTQPQIYEVLEHVLSKEDGLEQILKMSLESLMKSERTIHNEFNLDSSNGFRPRKTFGRGKILELRVPRTRSGSFYPLILALLKDQEEECKKIAFKLYSAGLTTEQVGDLFGEIYGKSYSTSQVSRLFDYARDEVQEWIERPLESYYPVCYIDATYISTRRVDSVSKEAYFTILGVRPDRTREVLAVFNNPTEGSSIWEDIFTDLKSRGVKEIGLIVSDGLQGIETVINKHFKGTEVQLCAVHLQRESIKYAKPEHKEEMAEDLKEVFATNNRKDTPELGVQRWKDFCNKWGKYYPVFKRRADNER
ncbi:MAG: IS256 family transposase, partial [Bacteroidales bacterium]|nr:IS256 family transposase [Bacteroidales bacterium]